MLAQVAVRSNAAITAPAGWTPKGNLRTQGALLEQALYYRVADATDTVGKTYQWSWTGAVDAGGGILAYSGVDTTDPFDLTPTDNAATSTTATATGLTTNQNNDMLVAFYGSSANTTITQTAAQGMTQEFTALSNGRCEDPRDRKRRNTGSSGSQRQQDGCPRRLEQLGRPSRGPGASALRGRLRHAHRAEHEPLGELSREHAHLHLHGGCGRDQQRLGHPGRSGRLERSVDDGREQRLRLRPRAPSRCRARRSRSAASHSQAPPR